MIFVHVQGKGRPVIVRAGAACRTFDFDSNLDGFGPVGAELGLYIGARFISERIFGIGRKLKADFGDRPRKEGIRRGLAETERKTDKPKNSHGGTSTG
jgi:hypothetical protein